MRERKGGRGVDCEGGSEPFAMVGEVSMRFVGQGQLAAALNLV